MLDDICSAAADTALRLVADMAAPLAALAALLRVRCAASDMSAAVPRITSADRARLAITPGHGGAKVLRVPIHCGLATCLRCLLLARRRLQTLCLLRIDLEHIERACHAADLVGQVPARDLTLQIPLGEGNHPGFQTLKRACDAAR